MLGDTLYDAIRNWEPRRPAYNLALVGFASAWMLLTGPHFRAALTFALLPKLPILAALAPGSVAGRHPLRPSDRILLDRG
jgi:hypothetical protein